MATYQTCKSRANAWRVTLWQDTVRYMRSGSVKDAENASRGAANATSWSLAVRCLDGDACGSDAR